MNLVTKCFPNVSLKNRDEPKQRGKPRLENLDKCSRVAVGKKLAPRNLSRLLSYVAEICEKTKALQLLTDSGCAVVDKPTATRRSMASTALRTLQTRESTFSSDTQSF